MKRVYRAILMAFGDERAGARVDLPDIATAKEGFWIDRDFKLITRSPNPGELWISPSAVRAVELAQVVSGELIVAHDQGSLAFREGWSWVISEIEGDIISVISEGRHQPDDLDAKTRSIAYFARHVHEDLMRFLPVGVPFRCSFAWPDNAPYRKLPDGRWERTK